MKYHILMILIKQKNIILEAFFWLKEEAYIFNAGTGAGWDEDNADKVAKGGNAGNRNWGWAGSSLLGGDIGFHGGGG